MFRFSPLLSKISLRPNLSTSIRSSHVLQRLFSSSELDEDGKFSFDLNIERHDNKKPIPAFRVMNKLGEIIDPKYQPNLGEQETVSMYHSMMSLNAMDTILYEAQRQGRISFYMTSFGEEATHVGSSHVLSPDDVIFGQYRETGVLLHRGFHIEECVNQCFGNRFDLGKGRQMPVHYGSRALNFHTISSPLGTQIPQASGAAYALRTAGKRAVVVCYFGEGAASEGDFHPALNFASVLNCPVIFFCRNNGYAISTPSKEQYHGDGIAARGYGYGIDTVRVDGNDIWAVYHAMKQAKEIALNESRPIIIEAMTYRVGHHSTSDDSTRYRTSNEVEFWKRRDNPLTRLRQYMEARGWWNADKEKEFANASRVRVLEALRNAEKHSKPAVSEMFNDVYAELPLHLQRQKQELIDHLAIYPGEYPNEEFNGF